jgi:hypothetical protein
MCAGLLIGLQFCAKNRNYGVITFISENAASLWLPIGPIKCWMKGCHSPQFFSRSCVPVYFALFLVFTPPKNSNGIGVVHNTLGWTIW